MDLSAERAKRWLLKHTPADASQKTHIRGWHEKYEELVVRRDDSDGLGVIYLAPELIGYQGASLVPIFGEIDRSLGLQGKAGGRSRNDRKGRRTLRHSSGHDTTHSIVRTIGCQQPSWPGMYLANMQKRGSEAHGCRRHSWPVGGGREQNIYALTDVGLAQSRAGYRNVD